MVSYFNEKSVVVVIRILIFYGQIVQETKLQFFFLKYQLKNSFEIEDIMQHKK